LEYFERAQNLVRSGSYEVIENLPDASHPPVYPIVLATAVALAQAGGALAAAKLANLVLAALTLLLLAALTRELAGRSAAIAVALVYAIYPRALLMPLLLASENVFAPLLVLLVWVAARRARRTRSLALAGLAGLVIGLAALTRSVGYLLALLWLIALLARRVPVRTILMELAILLAVQHLVMLPWAIRNQRAIGRFTFLNSVGGIGLFIGNNPHATGDWYDWHADLERARPGILARGNLAVDDAARREALEWIRAHPARAAALYVKKLYLIASQDTTVAGWSLYGRRISPPEPAISVLPDGHPATRHPRAVLWLLRGSAVLLVVGAARGFVLLFRRARDTGSDSDRALAALLFAAILYVPILSAPIAVNGRYRWESEDLCFPLAALAATSGLPRRGAKARGKKVEPTDRSRAAAATSPTNESMSAVRCWNARTIPARKGRSLKAVRSVEAGGPASSGSLPAASPGSTLTQAILRSWWYRARSITAVPPIPRRTTVLAPTSSYRPTFRTRTVSPRARCFTQSSPASSITSR